MTVKKLQKKAKLRNAEYFGLQEVLDRLYAQSAEDVYKRQRQKLRSV